MATCSGSDISSLETYLATLKCIDGVLYPEFVPSDHLEKLKSFAIRPEDIFIVCYPKSGTHWLIKIVYLIIHDGEDKYLDVTPSREEIVWIEEYSKPGHKNRMLEDIPNPRVFASHAYYSKTAGSPPNTSSAKYIYCARNPKDVVTSFFHHHVKRRDSDDNISFDLTWDVFFDCFMNGKVAFGSWWSHVQEWWSHCDESNVLFLKYEDLKKDLSSNIKLIADFLGQNLSQEKIEKIAQAVTFESMNATSVDWKNAHFLRKGVVGDWKNLFSPTQTNVMDSVYLSLKDSLPDFDIICDSSIT